ncbi:DUF4231 domain-containing protein [Corticimicrobacter populi]|uniref:DUF4231 domain-containing protein n=1 Tax=Corticimicrobacter populi TaxID=2175229 RepID=A0A2V1K1F4_9BURK|nr:DUF4231 domain-containing protein [Corticimicrobacter populi]PWF23003.1 DUF4231 domain-containing protein [Corticimicrobacter populi]
MIEKEIKYPALYSGASDLSRKSQSAYLWLLRMEYSLLIVAAFFSMNQSPGRIMGYAHAFIFVALAGLLIYRSKTKPEQDWYKGRALAESIKTSTWRYCMRASPFGDVAEVRIRRAEFRNHLREILQANRHIGDRIPPDSAADDQVTSSMDEVRALSLDSRKEFYLKKRIKEQRAWYASKAGYNKKCSRRWVVCCVATYGLAIALVTIRPAFPEWSIWPFEPLIVLASSIIGWMQIKKFNELNSAYTLTAHEIGIIQGRIEEIDSEEDFSDFVNEAELAFSREHTQWVARQNSI